MRRSRLRQSNPERLAKREALQFGRQAALCRRSRCSVPRCTKRGPSEPHHHPSRAAGGLDRDTLPLCRDHHDEVHRIGSRTFEERYGVNLAAEALRMVALAASRGGER